MKFLVTGANGFVGKALCKLLLADSRNQVTAIVRGDRELKDLEMNVCNVDSLISGFDLSTELAEIDCVFHLAARAHKMDDTAFDRLQQFREVNVSGTLLLAQQAAQAGVARFVYVSSVGVYGNSSETPFEEISKFNPHSDYAISKLEAEFELKRMAKNLDIELVIVRPVLVYGKNAPGNFGQLTKLISRIPFLPFGLADNRRSFISVSNLANFLLLCSHHPAAANQDFVISDGEDVSIKQFSTAIAKGLGNRLVQLPVPVSIMRLMGKLLGKEEQVAQLLGDLQVNCFKARSLLDWQPAETMSQAMSRLK